MKVVDSSNTINLLDQEAFETANGLWKGKKPPYVEVGVIRNTNFTNSGRIDLTDVARLPVEEKKLKTRTLQPGDIILERSGGGPKQPVGRVVYFNESDGKWSFSNFTSMIRVRDRKRFNSKYIFYILLHFYDSGATDPLQRRTTGIRNLDWKAYKESVSVPLWPLPEQYRIVAVLSLVQRAIEEQERLIQLTTELKKALMHKLFTEGTRGEPQKQTEIGPIPESWEMVEIADIFKFTSGKTKPRDTKPAPIDENQIPVYGGNGVLGYSSQFMLEESTLILGRVGEYCGCAHLTMPVSWVTDNALYVKEEKTEVNLVYIRNHFEYLNLNKYSNKMGQPLITQGIINRVKFGIPKPEEQDELAMIFKNIDNRLSQIKGKQGLLKDLFRTLLHQLMTAQIRVNDLDLSELGIEIDKYQ